MCICAISDLCVDWASALSLHVSFTLVFVILPKIPAKQLEMLANGLGTLEYTPKMPFWVPRVLNSVPRALNCSRCAGNVSLTCVGVFLSFVLSLEALLDCVELL